MATPKSISELDSATTPLTGTELIEVSQGGDSRQLSFSDFQESVTDLKTAQVTIATADVLTLNATPVTIVSAPGAGKAIEVVSATAEMTFNTTAYDTSGVMQLVTSGAGAAQVQWAALGFLFGTVSRIVHGSTPIATSGATQTQIIANTALTVLVTGANPATGDSDIIVRCMYRELSV